MKMPAWLSSDATKLVPDLYSPVTMNVLPPVADGRSGRLMMTPLFIRPSLIAVAFGLCSCPLRGHVGQGIPHWLAGDGYHAIERPIHLDDNKETGRQRAGTNEEGHDNGRIDRRVVAEAQEDQRNPGDQDHKKHRLDRTFGMFDQQPSR